ncbi:MAG: 5'/3'-nucleotidase SurE, partial [Acidimicrobiales bacterium]
MRILVTNDDGVHAPGLGAVTRALAGWAANAPPGEEREVVVVAPLANHSGAAAAVGTVYEREAIAFRPVRLPGAECVRAYGLDASPALSVIVGVLGAFGPRPDMVVSGINLGVNVGRSVLHSGTVGAALTAAQLGLRALAVSMRSGAPEDHWGTAAGLAVDLLPVLSAAPPRTVLNLNVPSVPQGELRGVRRGRISTAGLIKAAADTVHLRPAAGKGEGTEEGEVRLTLGAAVPSLGDVGDEDPEDDGALIAAGFASLTPLAGVREDAGPDA